MLVLATILAKLQLITSAAVATDVVVSYADRASHGGEIEGLQPTAIATATTTDILAVPEAGIRRRVTGIVVTNKGASPNTVTPILDVNGTDYQIGGAVTLAAGEWMKISADGAFTVYEAGGKIKVQVGSGGGSGDAVIADGVDQFTGNGNWKLFYTDGAGEVVELPLGALGTVLQSAGAAAAPTFGKAWVAILKTADETIDSASFGSRANSTTLGDDSHLLVPLESGKTYVVRFVVIYKVATGDPDLKWAVAYSGSTTGDITTYARTAAAGVAPGSATEVGGTTTSLPSNTLLSTANGTGRVEVEITLTTSSAGTLSFKWAQNTGDTDDLTVMKGSLAERMEVA